MKRSILLVLLTSLLLGACGPAYTDRDPTNEAVAAVAEWEESVGVLRRDFSFEVTQAAPPDSDGDFQGQAFCTPGEPAKIVLYQGRFRADDFEANVRHVMLHELVHIHLGCKDSNHSKDPSNLMFHELTDENLNASPDAQTVALIQEAWIR